MDRAVVLAIHADQIRQHGGAQGTRDEGALDSSLARPQNRWHHEPDADLCDLAAAYGFGIVRSHPFTDGNKRTGFQMTYVFLGLNGYRIKSSEEDVVPIIFRVAEGSTDESALADWLRAKVVRRRRRQCCGVSAK